MSCGYQGKHFGAWYEDATCIDGYLWDLDSCDEPGGGLSHGGDIPCPRCDTAGYVEYADLTFRGNSHQRRKARRAVIRKVRSWAGTPKKKGGAV